MTKFDAAALARRDTFTREIGIESPAALVLHEREAQRGGSAMIQLEGADRVVLAPDLVAGRQFLHVEREGKLLEPEAVHLLRHPLGALGSPEPQRLGAVLQHERAHEPHQPEKVIGVPVRDEDVGKGEAGLLVNAISADARFEGYTNKSANEAKLVRNVAKLGDLYFNTGDLIRFVDVGYTFGQRHTQFVDRLGDTFRWRGENCSTNEIAEVLQQFPQLAQANVYGVQIPGTEGRAGMAAINLAIGYTATNFDWLGFTAHVRRGLASYAQPVFIRVQDEANTTSTFKLLKGALKEQAYHQYKTGGDPVYVLLPKGERYVPMDAASYAAIMNGETRF